MDHVYRAITKPAEIGDDLLTSVHPGAAESLGIAAPHLSGLLTSG
jgi:hypothetical protein